MVVPFPHSRSRRIPRVLNALHYLRRRRIVAAGLAAAAGGGRARAQAPSAPRPLRLVVPFPAGGGTLDALARLLAPRLATALGQTVIVDNRPGAGGAMGTEYAARAEGDGLTVLFTAVGLAAVVPSVGAGVAWRSEDFASVGLVGRNPLGLFVRPDGPPDLATLIRMARERPGALNFGSSGNYTLSTLGMLLFQRAAGIEMTNVPYRGMPPIVIDLLAGRLDMALDSPPAWIGHVREGRLRMLAVTSAGRWADAPDVPSFAEAGLGGMVIDNWQGVQVPASTPRTVVARLSHALRLAVADPAVARAMEGLGIEPLSSSPEEMDRLIATDGARWRALLRDLPPPQD